MAMFYPTAAVEKPVSRAPSAEERVLRCSAGALEAGMAACEHGRDDGACPRFDRLRDQARRVILRVSGMRVEPYEPGPPMSEAFDGAIDRSTCPHALDRRQDADTRIGARDTLDNGYGLVRATSVADHNEGFATAAVRL